MPDLVSEAIDGIKAVEPLEAAFAGLVLILVVIWVFWRTPRRRR